MSARNYNIALTQPQNHIINPKIGNIMTKLLSALVAAIFAVVSLTPVAIAQEKKGEEKAMEKKEGKADKKKSETKKKDETAPK